MLMSSMAAVDRFGLSKYQLMELMSQRRDDAVSHINEYGGVGAIAEHLETNIKTGIKYSPGLLEARTAAFGVNHIPPKPARAFFALCLDALQDKTLLILIGAAILSIVLGLTVEQRKVIGTSILTL